jgi:alpha-tubulin suppressor-like RCC1 family protein
MRRGRVVVFLALCVIACRRKPQVEAEHGKADASVPPAAQRLFLGSEQSCVTSLSGVAKCWGLNDQYQLGAATSELCEVRQVIDDKHDSKVVVTRVLCAKTPASVSVSPIARISIGQGRACGWNEGGSLHCWGGTETFKPASEGFPSAFAPITAPAIATSEVSIGEQVACAVVSDGTLSCFGKPPHSAKPTTIAGLASVAHVVVGGHHVCALRREGSVLCWGDNDAGQLGDGTYVSHPTPTPVAPLTDVAQLNARGASTCARSKQGAVHCWGNLLNDLRQPKLSVPFPIAGITATTIGVGAAHACAVATDGSAWCWGANTHGQLGDGSNNPSNKPVRVAKLPSVEDIAAGDGHTCAREAKGSVWCWGRNAFGQLGNGSTDGSSTPVAVKGL